MFGQILQPNLGPHCHLLDQHDCSLRGPALFHSGGDPGEPLRTFPLYSGRVDPGLCACGTDGFVHCPELKQHTCPDWLWMTDQDPVIKIQPHPGPDLETALNTTPGWCQSNVAVSLEDPGGGPGPMCRTWSFEQVQTSMIVVESLLPGRHRWTLCSHLSSDLNTAKHHMSRPEALTSGGGAW